jgi:hypothetical protein
MKLPEKIIRKISLSEDEFEKLDPKIQICIIRLASENIELEEIIGVTKQLDSITIRKENVTFMGVGMKYHGNHQFSEDDIIKLEKEDNNPTDKTAIKILVDDKKVAYVAKEYTQRLREIPNLEGREIKFLRNFPYSCKLELILNE